MKKFSILMSLALSVFALMGCNGSDIENGPEKDKGKFTFTVANDALSRATVEKYNVVWQPDDRIAFGVVEHGSQTDTVAKAFQAAYKGNGKFEIDTTLDDTKSYDYYALWPWQGARWGANFNLPSKQKNPNEYSTYIYIGRKAITQKEQQIDSAMQLAPMYAWSNNGTPAAGMTVQLEHLASMLEFNVVNKTSSPVKFSSFKMSVPSADPFCGSWFFDLNGSFTKPSGNNYVANECTVTIEGASDELSPDQGWTFYMPIKPTTFAANAEIEFEITSADGIKCVVTKKIPAEASMTFEAGGYYIQTVEYTGANATYSTMAEVLVACGSLEHGNSSADSYDVTNATVYAQNGSNVIVGDGTAYMLAYNPSPKVDNGDVISISGKIKNWYEILEFDAPTVTKLHGGKVTFPNPAPMSDDSFSAYAAAPAIWYVSAKGLCTIDKKKIDVSGSDLQKYNVFADVNLATDAFSGYDGKNVIMYGFLFGYNSGTKKASFIATEVSEDTSAPSLILDPETLTFGADEFGANDYKAVTATVLNTTITDITSDATWCLGETVGPTVMVSVREPNTTGSARTATLTVNTAAGISKTITVTQEAKAVAAATIAQMIEAGPGRYKLSGVMVYAFNLANNAPNNVIVGDATGFALVYKPVLTTTDQGLSVGCLVDVEGDYILYENTNNGNRIYQFSGSAEKPVTMTITGNSPAIIYPNPLTFSHSDFAAYLTDIARIQYVAVNGTFGSDGITTADGDIYYNYLSSGVSFGGMTGKKVNCKGFVMGYNTGSSKISYMVTEVAVPSLEVSPKSLTFNAGEYGADAGKAIECTVADTDLSAPSCDADWLHVEVAKTHMGLTVYPIGENTSTSSRTATVTVNTAAGLSKTVSVTQYGKTGGTTRFVKVTSANDLTDGDYLIVCEESNAAFNGALTTLDDSGNYISVTINEGAIAATDATNGAVFTLNIAGKTIQSASGYYIGRNATSNGLNSSETTKYENVITISGGNATITSTGGGTLRFNSDKGQMRFRYYKSGQKAVQLYKKVN